MHISIINNDCIINKDHISPLGKITCDVLNNTGWDKYKHPFPKQKTAQDCIKSWA